MKKFILRKDRDYSALHQKMLLFMKFWNFMRIAFVQYGNEERQKLPLEHHYVSSASTHPGIVLHRVKRR
jgi:phytoene dehydrogenase-like protein